MTGRVRLLFGGEEAHGVWEISSEGLYCRTWANNWGDGKRRCFRASRSPNILAFDYASGSRGDADRYLYRLRPH